MPKRTSKKKSVKPSEEEVRKAVRARYTALATKETSCCSTAQTTMCSCGDLYSNAEVVSLPGEAIAVSAGCGNPTAIANLKPGMTVVDLGSGGGIDVFLSAKKIGPRGRAIGIDATPEMIYRARKTAMEHGYDNVEFRLGEIEHMPLEPDTADVIISNCVINLSPDKEQVFREAFRVLKPGGRLAVSDIVLLDDLPEEISKNMSAWSSCVSGAVSEKEYMGGMKKAGFEKIKVEDRVIYSHEQLTGYLDDAKLELEQMKSVREALKGTGKIDLSNLIASYRITAFKPKA
jgi:SAM-dependent methyltransferase